MKLCSKYPDLGATVSFVSFDPWDCGTDRTKLLVKSVCETAPKSLSCSRHPPPPPTPLSFRVWVSAMIGLYKMPLSYFPIRLKGNSKCICGNSLSPLVAQKKDFSPASQTSLTGLRLRLRGRLLRLEGNQNFYYALHRKHSRLCWFCDKRKPLL